VISRADIYRPDAQSTLQQCQNKHTAKPGLTVWYKVTMETKRADFYSHRACTVMHFLSTKIRKSGRKD